MKINNQSENAEIGKAILGLQNFVEELTKNSVNGHQFRASSTTIHKSVKENKLKSIVEDVYWKNLITLVSKVILVNENKPEDQVTLIFSQEITKQVKNLPAEKIGEIKNALAKINNFFPT